MTWTASLLRIRAFEIETLKKRLGALVQASVDAEAAIAVIEAEAQAETAQSAAYAEAGFYLIGYREGLKVRRAGAARVLRAAEAAEQGARDALFEAFEELKRVETVDAALKAEAARLVAREESQALDALALRKRAAA